MAHFQPFEIVDSCAVFQLSSALAHFQPFEVVDSCAIFLLVLGLLVPFMAMLARHQTTAMVRTTRKKTRKKTATILVGDLRVLGTEGQEVYKNTTMSYVLE